MKTKRSNKQSGFTIMEVAIAILLILLVGTTSSAALRMGLRTLGGSEQSAIASTAIREFREWTFGMTIEQIDALDATTMGAVMGDGRPLPEGTGSTLQIVVTPVDDSDPETVVAPEDSRSRLISLTVMNGERIVLEAQWLSTEH